MRDSFLRKLIAIIVQIIVVVIIFVVFRSNKYINKKYNSNSVQNSVLQDEQLKQAKNKLTDIVKKYRNAQFEELLKEVKVTDWYDIKNEVDCVKFYKIVLDIYNNEKLSVEDKVFLKGFFEGSLEYDEALDDFQDVKNEIKNSIENEV